MNTMLRAYLLGLFLALFVCSPAKAGSKQFCDSTLPRISHWLEYRIDQFIIQYALEGQHALHSPGIGHNAEPATIKDAALQMIAMRDMLDSMGFQHPLASERYRSQGVTHILVRFQDLQRLTGRAFDEVRRLPTGECVLIIHINSKYRSGNLTPAHEYFHLVQYGYTMFKRPWFLEGMARWAEGILVARRARSEALAQTEPELEVLFSSSYQVEPVWYALIEYCSEGVRDVPVPDHLSSLTYSTGKRVVADPVVPGVAFIRQVLEAFGSQDDRISDREGLSRHHWPEKFQRDPSHDLDMWNTLADVCPNELPPRDPGGE